MKKIIAICLFALVTLPVAAQTGSVAASDVLGKLHKTHPRLLLLKGEEKDILANIKKYPAWAGIHQGILAECDNIIDRPPVERIQIGRRLLDKSRECLRRMFQLSYAYRTTGDEKYFKRAEKEMLAVAGFSDWNPSHFLDVAEMTMAIAIGYDWFYDQLSADSRAIIREAIKVKGINPSFDNKNNSWLRAEHNWNQVCNAGMTFGALAIAEDEPELASKVITRAVGSIPKAMVTSYQPDGAYPEGFGYWDYGTSFNVLFLDACQKALGTDFGLSNSPGFLKTAGFVVNMVGPTGTAHNWGDSGLRVGLTPAIFWFAAKTGDPSVLYDQKKFLETPSPAIVRNRLLPAVMIWGAKTNLSSIKAPAKTTWVGQGELPVALMRSSWNDPNALFVGFKAGSPAVNHAHMDIGSFVLDANGERWAMDFGAQEYNSLEAKGVDLWNRSQNSQRWEVFRLNNLAHNTLTFDNQHQLVKGYAKVDSWLDKNGQKHVISDLSKVYEGQVSSAKRGIALSADKSVVVRDEIKTGDKPVTMRWNLLTPATVKVVDGKTVELTQNGKTMFLVFDTKAAITVKTWPTTPTHDYDAPNPNTQFVGFEVNLPANTAENFNVFFTQTIKTKPTKALSEWPVQ
jgi:hypothetical protein